MSKPTPAQLDALFPDRHEVADRIKLHPALRENFIPLHEAPLTPEQRDAIFPPARRVAVMRDMVDMLTRAESIADHLTEAAS